MFLKRAVISFCAWFLMRRFSAFLFSVFVLLFFSASLGFILTGPSSVAKPADVVVVLGGVDRSRFDLGRSLILDGHSDRLLIIHPLDEERSELARTLKGSEIYFDSRPSNTWDEALVVRSWMKSNGHMLRMQYAWWSVFRGTGLTFTLIATAPPWWHPWRWWQNPQARGFVKSEVMKLGYYLVVYWFGFWQ